MQIRYGAISDTGQKRSRNEDAFLAWAPADSWLNGFFVVADGMGGHEAGDVASDTTIQRLQAYIERGDGPGEESGGVLLDGLEQELIRISSGLREMAAARAQARGMGSTATAAAFVDRQIHIAHVGDTRIYRFRGGELRQLTLDHSWVAEQQRRGWISAEQAANHPQKNILTQALGTQGELEVYKKSFPVRSEDRYLICSDGLHGAITIERVQSILEEVPDAKAAAQLLIDSANAAGGPDNITAIVCDAVFSEEDAAAPPLPDPENDGIDLAPPEPKLDDRPDEDSAARSARLKELDALHDPPLSDGELPESGPGKGPTSRRGRWIAAGITLLAIAIAIAVMQKG